MIYKRYGEIFRKLRKQRNLSLAHFEALGISKSALGKFERGEAMMAFDRVMLALQELDVTLAEFEHFLNNFSQSDTESFADDIFEAYIKNDKDQLLYLSKQLMEEGYPILSLTAKVAIEQTDFKNSSRLKDVETFKNFLYNAKLWGYIELCIFYHTVSYFKTSEILYLLDTCFSSNSYLFNVPKYRIKFLHVGYSSVIILSRRGAKESSLYLLKNLKHLISLKPCLTEIYKILQTAIGIIALGIL